MQQPFPYQVPRRQTSRKRVSMIVGGVLLALAILILMLLALLFIAGGGGDTDRFAVVVRNFVTTSAVVGVLGLASLVFGLITRK